MSISALLVDDHSVVREGLRHILEASGQVRCSQAASAEEAMALLRSGLEVQVVLMDIILPGMSGLEALSEIRKEFPAVKVVVISMHPEERFAVRAERMGAAGYLSKGNPADEILRKVLALASGNNRSEPGGNMERKAPEPPSHSILSDREFQVLGMIGSGKPVAEIARTLELSVKTVSTHRERILRKMGFHGNMEIIRYVLQEGLLDGDALQSRHF